MTRLLALIGLIVSSAVLVVRAPAQDDETSTLRTLLDSNEYTAENVQSTVQSAVDAAAAAALPVLSDGLQRFCDLLQGAEVSAARASKQLELMDARVPKPDDKVMQDERVQREKARTEAATQRACMERIAAGLGDLLAAVGKKGESGAVPVVTAVYERETQRANELDRKLEEVKGKLAQAASKLYGLEQDKAPAADIEPVALDQASLAAKVERLESTLRLHRQIRLTAAGAAGALLAVAKGAEVDATLKNLTKKVDSKAPPEDRTFWVDLYARLGKEAVPAELHDVAQSSARQAKRSEDELAKLRDKYDKAKEALFKSVNEKTNTVSKATQDAFNALQAEVQKAAESQRAMEKLRAAAAGAMGAAVAALPVGKREKAITWALGIARDEKDLEVRCAVVESLGALDAPGVREALRKLLLDDKETKARLAALEALVALKDLDAMEVVRARLLQHTNWRVRAAAVSALVRVPQKETIPALIAALDVEVGRLREDLTQALQRLTGQSFAMSGAVWTKWWDENQLTFRVEDVPTQRRAVVSAWDKAAQGKVTFYGISSISKKVAFVLDVSKSMQDPASDQGERTKFDVAKEQLKQAITGLSDGDQFAIVYFAGTAARWAPKMTVVTPQVKDKVMDWIGETLEMGPGTNIHAGMKEALSIAGLGARDSYYESAIDTIFFLSDGDATVGEVTDALELRRLIRDWNRLSRIRIHTIGVGKEPNIALLYGIAEDSGGQFQHR